MPSILRLVLESADGRVTRYLYARSTPLRRTAEGKHVSVNNLSGDSACSAAASAWRLKKADASTFKVLAGCRAKAAARGKASKHRAAGNDAKAQVLERRADTGKVGAEHRRALAESLSHVRTGKHLSRAVKALDTTPADPIAAAKSRLANRKKLEAVPKRLIPVKSKTVAHKEATAAVANALDARSTAENAWRNDVHPDTRGFLFQQAGRRYGEAQAKLKALRAEVRQRIARTTPVSNRSSEEYTGHIGPTRGETQAPAAAPVKPTETPTSMSTTAAAPKVANAATEPPKPTPASGPSLRDQAAAHRAAKGTLEDRLAPIRAKVAGHRAVAGQHEAAIDKHGTVLDAFRRFMAKGKAPKASQVSAAERAEAGKADARHEAFRAHAAANRIEQRVAKFKSPAQTPTAPATTPAPAAAPIDPATFGPRALAAAKTVGPEGRFMGGNKVFINHAHRAYESAHGPMPLDQFKAHLLTAQNSRHVDMSRADMVEAMNPTDVRESDIATNRDANGFGGSGFHFIRDDYTPAPSSNTPAPSSNTPAPSAPDDPASLDREHVEANKRIWATQAAYRDEKSRAVTDADQDALAERYRPRFAAHDAAIAAIQARRAALASKTPRPAHAPEVGRFEPTYDARSGGYYTGD